LTATSAVTASVTALGVFLRTLTASSVAVSASIRKAVGKALTASHAVTASLVAIRVFLKSLTASVIVSASMVKSFLKSLVASVGAFGQGPGGVDAYTTFLLHGDGTNGSTTFKDEKGHPIQQVGMSKIDTSQSKFGGSSILTSDGSAYGGARTPDTPDIAFGSGDFTVDFWVRFSNVATGEAAETFLSDMQWFSPTSYGWWFTYARWNGTLQFSFNAGDEIAPSNIGVGRAWTPVNDTWYHLAAVRSGNTLTMYVNGTQLGGTYDMTGITINDATCLFNIGYEENTYGRYLLQGWMDEIRISKGIARWTSNFTPPTLPYGDSYITKRVGKFATATLAATAALTKRVNKPLAATAVVVTASMARIAAKVKLMVVTVASTASMQKIVGKLVAVTTTVTGLITRSITKFMDSTLFAQASLAASKVWGRILSATVGVTGSISRGIGKVITAVSNAVAALVSLVIIVPHATVPPQVGGNPNVGGVLNGTTGVWSGSAASYTYQWQKDPGGGVWVNIPGQSGTFSIPGQTTTYTVVQADVNNRFRLLVTATNANGTGVEVSNEMGPATIIYNRVVSYH